MRRLSRAYAWLFGYFWLPCPLCGRMFGGHEIGGTVWLEGSENTSTRIGRATCRLHRGSYLAASYAGPVTSDDVRLPAGALVSA